MSKLVLIIVVFTMFDGMSSIDEYCKSETCSRDPRREIRVNCNDCRCDDDGIGLTCTDYFCPADEYYCQPDVTYTTPEGYFCCCSGDGNTLYCTSNPRFPDLQSRMLEPSKGIDIIRIIDLPSSDADSFCLSEICKKSYDNLVNVDCNICSCPYGDGCQTKKFCQFEPKCVPGSMVKNKLDQQCCCGADGFKRFCPALKPALPSLEVKEAPLERILEHSICMAESCSRSPTEGIRINCNTCSCTRDGRFDVCSEFYCQGSFPFCEYGKPPWKNSRGESCCCDKNGNEICAIQTKVLKHITEYKCFHDVCEGNPDEFINVDCRSCSCLTKYCTVVHCPEEGYGEPGSYKLNAAGKWCCCGEDGHKQFCSNKVPQHIVDSIHVNTPSKADAPLSRMKESGLLGLRRMADDFCYDLVCSHPPAQVMKKNCNICYCDRTGGCLTDKECHVQDACSPGEVLTDSLGNVCCCGEDGYTRFCKI